MTETIRAIETEYAGCRFRSRLEARWAVFLTKLAVEWQYEQQGFEFDRQRYLPDFYLPEQQIFLEVKGSDETLRETQARLIAFSRSLQKPRFLVVLGEVPEITEGWAVPTHLAFTQGEECMAVVLGGPDAHTFVRLLASSAQRTRPSYIGGVTPWPAIADAYRAARRARFEHGERG